MKGSRTFIYPGTIKFHLAINAKPRYNPMSYRCQPDTIACILSTPKPCIMSVILSAINVKKNNSYQWINAKPPGAFSLAIDVNQKLVHILLRPNQMARSCQLSMLTLHYLVIDQ